MSVPDARRGVVVATDIRPPPDVTGSHRHTLVAGDRLDVLAWRYYGDPSLFWRLCDANPEVLSPLALIGLEALRTTRLPVTWSSGSPPPWSSLLAALASTVGVQDSTVLGETTLEEQRRTIDGRSVTVTVERTAWTVRVTFHLRATDAEALAEVVRTEGFGVGPPREEGPLGRPLVVPVPPTG